MCEDGCVEFSNIEIHAIRNVCNRLNTLENRLYATELRVKRLDQVLGEHVG